MREGECDHCYNTSELRLSVFALSSLPRRLAQNICKQVEFFRPHAALDVGVAADLELELFPSRVATLVSTRYFLCLCENE